MRRLRREDGVTLVEMLVAVAMSSVVFGAVLTTLDVFQRQSRTAQIRNETQSDARDALDRLARDLRNVASPSTTTPGALELAQENNVVFETVDPNKVTAENPTNKMRVRYCLDTSTPANEVLWRQVKRWGKAEAPMPASTACPDLTAGDWESSTRLVTRITNDDGGQKRPIFNYGPAGAETAAQITSVEPTLYLNYQPGHLPGESQLTTSIGLRNQNRTPSASFTAIELGSERRVVLNASESVDPNGLALAYKWWQNGSELSTTAQQYETAGFAKGTVVTFKLEVTNPGGLSATTERTLTIK
jgi:prepilin-type N-terminal cleavage/methylation domain-containing protein